MVDSRPYQEHRGIRRRRECAHCNWRYTTFEYIETDQLTVLKSDGRREPFDPGKVLYGVKLACNKRPVTGPEMANIVERIVASLHALGSPEVTTQQIGEAVMEELRTVDEIAYVRFASVYRKFKDKNEFLDEMKRLLE